MGMGVVECSRIIIITLLLVVEAMVPLVPTPMVCSIIFHSPPSCLSEKVC